MIKYLGMSRCNGYSYTMSDIIPANEEALQLNLTIDDSKIAGAGKGVFANSVMKGGQYGYKLCEYRGELLTDFAYDAIDRQQLNFTGIELKIDSSLFIWKGIVGTLGATINSAETKSKSNVEFKISQDHIDNKHINGKGFVEIWVKPRTSINIGDELLLYYSKGFFKQYKKLKSELDEVYCCVCLQYHSLKPNVMYLCDACNAGFHHNCLMEPPTDQEDTLWLCNNCIA